jgi:TolB protein
MVRKSQLALRWFVLAIAIGTALSACGADAEELVATSAADTVAASSPIPTAMNTPIPSDIPTPIPSPTATPIPEPTPLGGGGKIAFSSDRDGDFEIYLMNSDGTNQIRLTNQSTNDFFPEFSPDGDMLIFFAVDPESDPEFGEFQFVGIDGTHMGTLLGLGLGGHSWSPDSKSIALAIVTGEGNSEILIGEFGGMPRLLTSDPAPDLQPEWSPDGKTLAFISFRYGIPKIYLMDASGNNVRRLTESDRVEIEPSWSPDGTKIAFVSGDNVNTQIYIMNSDGTEVTQVTEGPGYNEHPTWSPDGTMLAFWSNRSGNLQIYTIRSDGTELTRLTSNAFNDENPDWAHSATETTPPTFPLVTANDPFIGTWVSVDPADESNQQLWISDGNGVYNIFYIDLVATSCGLDGAGNPIAGYGISTGTADGNVLSTDIVYWCLSDPESFLGTVHVDFTYDVSRDALADSGYPGYPSFIWSRR